MTTRRRSILLAAAAAPAAALLSACGGGGGGSTVVPPPSGNQTLLALVQADASFSLLVQAIDKGGMGGTLGDSGASLTLFAADNAAFDRAGARLGYGDGAGLVSALSDAQWAGILRFGIVPQALSLNTLRSYGVPGGTRPDTLYSFEDYDNAKELIFDVSTGPLNIWDGVGRTSITLPDGDIGASNGVMHMVSDPLLPRGVLTLLRGLRANSDYFSGFAASADASDMAGRLDSGEAFTVFAPSSARVDASGLSSTRVRRHIVAGRLDGGDFSDGRTVEPLSGGVLTIRQPNATQSFLYSGATQVAEIIDTDFWANNGVIHVLDRLIP